MLGGLLRALACSLALAAASTFGDFIWARFISEHKAVFGVAHGFLLGAVFGLVLGLVRARPAAGAAGGAAIILGGALAFYALRPLFGYSAMFVSWMLLWLAFAFLSGRVLGGGQTKEEAIGRGALAAVGSGLAFYAVSGIWSPFDPNKAGYAFHFASWTVAFLPGFLALLVRRRA